MKRGLRSKQNELHQPGLGKSTARQKPDAATRSSQNGNVRFNEAAGKVIDQIRWVSMPGDIGAFEVRFTDNTFLFLEPLPRFVFRARLIGSTNGQIEDLHDYGILPDRAVAKDSSQSPR